MKSKNILIISLLFLLVLPLFAAEPAKTTAKKTAAKTIKAFSLPTEPTGASFNPANSFPSSPGDSVDPASGALVIKQTDLVLPGKAGLDLEIARSYNSRAFKSNPRPDHFRNTNEIWNILICNKPEEVFNFRVPLIADQWGGWIGQGWQSNIGGVLVVGHAFNFVPINLANTMPFYIFNGLGWKVNECPNNYDSIRIMVDSQSYEFDQNLKPKDKLDKVSLKRNDDGYILTVKDGKKYYFAEKRYFKKEQYAHYWYPNDHYEFWSEIYYLSSVEDTNGNKIKYEYDKFGDSFNHNEEHTEKTEVFGVTVAVWYKYEKALIYSKFLRPSKIIDSFGRVVDIHYRAAYADSPLLASMIDSLSYKDSDGRTVSYQYVYDANNCLVEVIPPEGNPTHFSYSSVDQGLGDKYEDRGNILTGIVYPTGASASYNYEWYSVGSQSPTMKVEKDQALSSFVVSSRRLNSLNWNYSYGGGSLYSRYGEDVRPDTEYKEDKGEAWNIKQVTVSDPLGETDYEYEQGLPKSIKNAVGHITTYYWDYINKILIYLDTNKNGLTMRTEYANYDYYGNPHLIREFGDPTISSDDWEIHAEYQHDSSPIYRDNHLVDRVNHSWLSKDGKNYNEVYFNYDPVGNGNLIEKREKQDAGLAITSYKYDSAGNLVVVIDPNSNVTQFSYTDGSPKPTKVSNLLTKTSAFYINTGLLKSESDYNGNLTSYSYDSLGRLLIKTNPDGTNIKYAYNDAANRVEVADENGNISRYNYDSLGRLSAVEKPEGVEIGYQYNPHSKISAVTMAGKKTSYDYDQIDRLVGLTYPGGATVRCAYNRNQIEMTDPENNATNYKYDGQGNLLEVDEVDGSKTLYAYTPTGKLARVSDARGLITEYEYDRQSRLTKVKNSDGTSIGLGYDLVGNLVRKSTPNDETIRYRYDTLNRLTAINYRDPKYDLSYGYDESASSNGKGLMTSQTDPSGRSTFSYDKRGKLTARTQTIGPLSMTTNYSYDNAGYISAVQDLSGTTYYDHDGLGWVIGVKREIAGSRKTIASYIYNPTGTVKEIDYFNGLKTTYSYDQRDRLDLLRLTDSQGKELLKHDYDYDGVGNRTALNIANVESITYNYDQLYRLTGVHYTNSEGDSTFKYDPVGNRTSHDYPYGSMKYFYDGKSNRLDHLTLNLQGKTSYSYDQDGNLTKAETFNGEQSSGATNYLYDPEDRLTAIKAPDGTEVNYTYSGGERVKKSTPDQTTIYLYDLAGNVLCETDTAGGLKGYYVYANGQRLGEGKSDGTFYVFHNDVLGSPALISNQKGEIVQKYLYEPFGSILASKGSNENRYTFTGKEYDRESDLFYFGARYYDPQIGRFLTQDLAQQDYENPQSLNRYVYCQNNPLVFVDPDGNDPRPIAYFNKILRPGDIIMVHSPGIIEDLIRAKTESYWNHTAIYVGEGTVVEMRAVPGKAVYSTPLEKIVNSSGDIGVYRYKGKDSIEKGRLAVNWARESLNRNLQYDYPSIISYGYFRDTKGLKYICSEHTWQSYLNANVSLSPRDKQITPGDIGRSKSLDRIDSFNFGGGVNLNPGETKAYFRGGFSW